MGGTLGSRGFMPFGSSWAEMVRAGRNQPVGWTHSVSLRVLSLEEVESKTREIYVEISNFLLGLLTLSWLP